MKDVVCEVCGSKDIKKRGKLHSCNSCGSEYIPETSQDSSLNETDDIFAILDIEDLRNENLSDTEELFESSFDFRNDEGEVLDEKSMEIISAYLDDLKVKFLEKSNSDGNNFKEEDLKEEPLKTEFLEYIRENMSTIDENTLDEYKSDKNSDKNYHENNNKEFKKEDNKKNESKSKGKSKNKSRSNQIREENSEDENNLNIKTKSKNKKKLNKKDFLNLIVNKKYFNKEIYKKYTEFSKIINKNTSKSNSKNSRKNKGINILNLQNWEKNYYNSYYSAYQSSVNDFKISDVVIYFKEAIEKIDDLNKNEKIEELKFDILDLINGLGNWTLDGFSNYHFEEELETLILNLKELINALDEILEYFSQDIVELNDETYITYTSILKWAIEICRDHFYILYNERDMKEKVERGQPQFYYGNQYKQDSKFSDYDKLLAETNDELRKFALEKYDYYLEKIKKINPSFEEEKIKRNDNGGCYIATAIYGSYNSDEVLILRKFRDNTLFNSIFGRIFVYLYYFFSPKLVKLFGNKRWFNFFFKGILDKIILKLEKKYL